MLTKGYRSTSINRRKVSGLVILLLPVGVLLLFGIGEMAGGIISGAVHFIQLAPLILLAILAWKRPYLGGVALLCLGALLALLYPLLMHGRFPLWVLLVSDLMFFVPAVVSGVLLLSAARRDRPR